MTDAGKKTALKSGNEIERLKKQLDRALEDWTAATESVEAATTARHFGPDFPRGS